MFQGVPASQGHMRRRSALQAVHDTNNTLSYSSSNTYVTLVLSLSYAHQEDPLQGSPTS